MGKSNMKYENTSGHHQLVVSTCAIENKEEYDMLRSPYRQNRGINLHLCRYWR